MPARTPYIDGLNERERIVVDQLARGKTLREISRITGLCERTIYNYRKRPHVQRAIYGAQQELIGQASGQAISVTAEAVEVLTQIMNNPLARAADRIAASRAIMNGAQQYTERKILERQLADLEAQLKKTLQLSAAPSAAIPEDDEAPDPLAGEDLIPSANVEDGDE